MNESARSLSPADGKPDGWTRFWFTSGSRARIDSLRRIAAGGALFYLLTLALDLNALCGPQGLLPRAMVANLATYFGQQTSFRPSWLMLTDSSVVLWATWLIAVATAVGLMLLWRPRWTTPATLVMILMFVHRTWLVTGLFEWALTTLLFYLCFAVDDQDESWNAGLILRLCQVHLTATYVAIGLSQLGGATWWAGDAVWWLMANSESRLLNLTFLGRGMVGLYAINAATHALVAVALAFPVLIWTTKRQQLLLKVMLAYWLIVTLLTGWLGYGGLMLAATWVSFKRQP